MYCTLVACHLSVVSHAQDPWSREAGCLDAIIQEAQLCPIEQQSADRLPHPPQTSIIIFCSRLLFSASLSFVS